MGAGARRPRGAVEAALEGGGRLGRGEAERTAGRHGHRIGVGVDGGVGCRRVGVGDDVGPPVGRRRRVGVGGEVDGAHVEGVRPGRQAGQCARAGARRPRRGVERALVGQVGAGGAVVAAAEAERHGAGVRRVARHLAPRGARRDDVRAFLDRGRDDGPLPDLGREVAVVGDVGGAHLEAVVAGLEELRVVVRAGAGPPIPRPRAGCWGPAARRARAVPAARSARSGRVAGRPGTRTSSPSAGSVSSVAVKANVAPKPLAPSAGPPTMAVTGDVMSTVLNGTLSLRLQAMNRHCSGRPLPLARLPPPSTLSSSEAMP